MPRIGRPTRGWSSHDRSYGASRPRIGSILFVGKRAFAAVLVAAVLVAVGVGFLLSIDVTPPVEEDRDVLGQRELVRVTFEDASTTRTAEVATSVGRSTISYDVAEELDIDVDAAPTVEFRTADGTEDRAIVPVRLEVGTRSAVVRAAVTERSTLEQDVLLGRDVIGDALVDASAVLLTDLGTSADSNVRLSDTLLGRDDPLGARSLLALLPVGALVIVILRYLVGVSTLGTFAPILVAVAFLQAGVVPALGVLLGFLVIGMLLEPLLHRIHMPRVARLGVLIGVSSMALVALTGWAGADGAAAQWGAAFPLVVAAGLVEQVWDVAEADGPLAAVGAAGGTLAVALATIPVLLAEPVRRLGQSQPLLVILLSLVFMVAAGSYRGLRLAELVRFRGAARRHGAPV